jgi:insertion element IS1 protein InsB
VAWVLGGRDDAGCQRLPDQIGLSGEIITADNRDGFRRLIPSDQPLTGKQYTPGIERDHSNIRHFLARFRCRTKGVSRQAYKVDLSLGLYHHLHDNLDNLKACL